MNKNLIGIIQDSTGCYIFASLAKSESGGYRPPLFKANESISFLDELKWGSSGIVFGVPVKYRPIESQVVYEHHTEDLNAEKDNLSSFANIEDLNFAKSLLDSNLVKITSEDSFLTTIPIHLSDYNNDSFISIYFSEGFTLVGLTVNNKQKLVFKLLSDQEDELIGFLGRLERYWSLKYEDINFPEMVIFINRNDSPKLLPLKPHLINNLWLADLTIDKLRALGLALSQSGNNTPVFSQETERAKYKDKRLLLNLFSLSILALTVLTLTFLYAAGKYKDFKLKKYKDEYTRIITSDAEVKDLNERNRELAATILYMESNISKRTRWAEFLYLLGKGAPEGLFIEKLGSEPVKGYDNQIKIALLGFSSKEGSITKLISLLQKTSYITKVSLVSMEKDKKRKDRYRYKVLCTLLSDK